MKTKLERSVSPGVRRVGFILACLLIAGAGGTVKIAVDGLIGIEDEMEREFLKPSLASQRHTIREEGEHRPSADAKDWASDFSRRGGS